MLLPAAVILLAGLAFEPPDTNTNIYTFRIGANTLQVPTVSKSWIRHNDDLHAVDALTAETFARLRPFILEESDRLNGIALIFDRMIAERLRQAHQADNDDAVTAYTELRQNVGMTCLMNVAVREFGRIPVRDGEVDVQRNAHNLLVPFVGQIMFLDMATKTLREIEDKIRLDTPPPTPPALPPDQRREKKRRASLG